MPSPHTFFVAPLLPFQQAVYGWGASKEIHVLLSVHEPTTGIPNFREWLKVQEEEMDDRAEGT